MEIDTRSNKCGGSLARRRALTADSSWRALGLWATVLLTAALFTLAKGNTPAPWMGFFPVPARGEGRSMLATLRGLSRHGDVVLLQRNIPWEDFYKSESAPSRAFSDLANLVRLSREKGLRTIFVVDALNGLDRRAFYGVPAAWGRPSFADARVRRAFKNFALRIVREFHPRYLGLGSEVNTYMAAHPGDAANLVSLYRQTYAAVKNAAPETQIFSTFQWDELRLADGGINWQPIRAFEPQLDLWVISSYPCLWLGSRRVPADYYSPLAYETEKPLAVGEGGCSSRRVGRWPGSDRAQVDYLSAIAEQLGNRLEFWIYLLYNDLDPTWYNKIVSNERDRDTLELFYYMGLADAAGKPKPALDAWDTIRQRLQRGR